MFTVKQLSRIAGITPRTLHYYDQIGLLKPSRVGENGYRYYGQEALLLLQQILLYRQLAMPLEEIKRIVAHWDFNAIKALEVHRDELYSQKERMERLIHTVENTIRYLKGELDMTQEQLFEPFNDEQQAEYEKEAMQMYDPVIFKASNRKWKGYSPADKQRIADEGNAVYRNFLQAIPKGPASPEAQACVVQWRRHLEYFWVPNNDQLLGLVDGYNNDLRFKANFDKIDPRLAGFIRDAVIHYLKDL